MDQDPMQALLREGERVAYQGGDVVDNDASYDDFLDVMRAEGAESAADAEAAAHEANLHAFVSARAVSEARHPSIPIPPSLADIASQVKPLALEFEEPALELTSELHREDRGEMGGKRKKPLTERAGWKDMEEKSNQPKKRGRNTRNKNSVADAFVGYLSAESRQAIERGGESSHTAGDDLMDPETALAMDMVEAQREMGLSSGGLAEVLGQTPEQIEATMTRADQPGDGPVDETGGKAGKGQRALQNRMAQQSYRFRREERMKELQAQADALMPTREALAKSHEQLKKAATEFDVVKIQLSALQATLQSLNRQGVSILTNQYNFPMDPSNLKDSEAMRPGPIDQSDVDKAFDQLERQSRELAMTRKAA